MKKRFVGMNFFLASNASLCTQIFFANVNIYFRAKSLFKDRAKAQRVRSEFKVLCQFGIGMLLVCQFGIGAWWIARDFSREGLGTPEGWRYGIFLKFQWPGIGHAWSNACSNQ